MARLEAFEQRRWWRKWWQAVVPPVPDFVGMLHAQAQNLHVTLGALAQHLASPTPATADHVNRLVEDGHTLRDATLGALYASFITPIDREDIFRIAMAIDHVLDYLKNTIREVEVLQVDPDVWIERMVEALREGATSLADALAHFGSGKGASVASLVKTRQAERRVEDIYRDALHDMFQGQEYLDLTKGPASPPVIDCLDFVLSRMKRREVYRHLSNAADRLAHAGEALRDISIKYDDGGLSGQR